MWEFAAFAFYFFILRIIYFGFHQFNFFFFFLQMKDSRKSKQQTKQKNILIEGEHFAFCFYFFSPTAPAVILDLEKLPPCPSRTQCPECRQFIMTETFSTVSSVTWLVCLMTALIGYESISWSRSKDLIGSSWAASPFLSFHICLQGSCFFFFLQLPSRLLLHSLLPRQVQNYHAQVPKVPNVTPNHQKTLRGKVSLFYLSSKN